MLVEELFLVKLQVCHFFLRISKNVWEIYLEHVNDCIKTSCYYLFMVADYCITTLLLRNTI